MSCQLCRAHATKKCSACKIAYYCSEVCQRRDFKNHLFLCTLTIKRNQVKRAVGLTHDIFARVLEECKLYGYATLVSCHGYEDIVKLYRKGKLYEVGTGNR